MARINGRAARVLAGGLLVAVAAGLAMPASAQIDPSIQPSLEGEVAWPQPTNAAPIYWRAFFFYQTNESLKGTDWSVMLASDDESGYALSASELAELEQTGGVIRTAMRASKVQACTWEVDYEQGIGALLPHLGPMRNLARLLAVDIRRCVMEGDIDGAVERLEAIHGFARHCRGDGILISSLVSCAISSLASSQTTELLARVALTPEQQARLVAAIDAYGSEDPFAVKQAITNEGVWLTAWLAQEIREGRLSEQMDMVFNLGMDAENSHVESIKRMSNEMLIEDLRRCRQYYTDAVSVWDERDAAERLEVMGELVEQGQYGLISRVLAAALSKSREADERGQRTLEASRSEILSDETAPAN